MVDFRPASCAAAFFSFFLATFTAGSITVGGGAGISTAAGGGGGGAGAALLRPKHILLSPIQMGRNQPLQPQLYSRSVLTSWLLLGMRMSKPGHRPGQVTSLLVS